MTKKSLIILVLAVLVAGSAFAQSSNFSLSLGGGGYFANDFGGGAKASVDGIEIGSLKTPYYGGGGFIFCDLTYFEISFGFLFTSGEWADYGYGIGTITHDVSFFGTDVNMYGKYPFALGDNIKIYPLLGFLVRTVRTVKIDGEKIKGEDDLSTIWLKFGGGLDYSVTKNIYLRMEVLYGIRMSNKFEDDLVDLFKSEGRRQRLNVDAETILGHGLDIKLGLGFKLF